MFPIHRHMSPVSTVLKNRAAVHTIRSAKANALGICLCEGGSPAPPPTVVHSSHSQKQIGDVVFPHNSCPG